MNAVVERIERMRTVRGWTVYKLSSESGVSQQAIHKWIGSDTYPTIPNLIQICDAFQISLVEFFGWGDITEANFEEKQLMENWRKLSKPKQDAVKVMIKSYLEK